MFSSKVSRLLEKIPVSNAINVDNFKGVERYFRVIKSEYSRMFTKGASKLLEKETRKISELERKQHPRREALIKTGKHKELLELTDVQLDTWFNENSSKDLYLGDTDLSSYFFPSEIHTEIHRTFDTSEKHSIKYPRSDGKTIEIKVNIEYARGSGLSPKEKIMTMMRTLILGAISPTEKTYDVIIYLSDSKKDFKNTTGSKKLGSSNVNSGVTTIYYDHNTVNQTTVFRREEMGKLLIHELIHNLEFDFGFNKIDELRDLHSLFNVPRGSDILLNEAYTETVACIINSMLCCIESGKTLVSLQKYLKLELLFNLFQTAKILDYYGFSRAEEINMPDDYLGRFNQQSNVLSYFFLKTALLHNFQRFIEYTDKYTINFCLIDAKSHEVQTTFVDLLISSTRRPDFIDDINQMMRFITNNRDRIPEDLSSTLRMTCVE